jgi:TonB family protein
MKKTKRSILISLMAFIVVPICANGFFKIPAADAFKIVPPNDWDRYKTSDGEFSVSLPVVPAMSSYSVRMTNITRSPLRHLIGAYEDGVVYAIYVFDRKQSLEEFTSAFRQSVASDFKRDVKVDGIPGKEYTFENEDRRAATRYFATEHNIYVFEVCGALAAQPEQRITKFLSSIKFSETGPAQVLVDGPGNPWTPPAGYQEGAPPQVFSGKDVTKKVVVISKPEPTYTEEARQEQVTGTVVIRCIFSASGKVDNIHFVSGLEHGLNDQAGFAAKQIKFIPATKDGHFVSMWMELQYNFNLY